MSTATKTARNPVIEQVVSKTNKHLESCTPGQPQYFKDAHERGDFIAQGDFIIAKAEVGDIPDDFKPDPKLTLGSEVKLVPGKDQTKGSRHCMVLKDGVEILFAPNFTSDDERRSCYIKTGNDTAVITHPVHGHVHLTPNSVFACWAAREYSKEQAAERRARD